MHNFENSYTYVPTSLRPPSNVAAGARSGPRFRADGASPYLEQANIYNQYNKSINWKLRHEPAAGKAEDCIVRVPVRSGCRVCWTRLLGIDPGFHSGNQRHLGLQSDLRHCSGRLHPGSRSSGRPGSLCGSGRQYAISLAGSGTPYTYVRGFFPKNATIDPAYRPRRRRRATSFANVTDGLSNTIAIAESSGRPYVYIKGAKKLGGGNALTDY